MKWFQSSIAPKDDRYMDETKIATKTPSFNPRSPRRTTATFDGSGGSNSDNGFNPRSPRRTTATSNWIEDWVYDLVSILDRPEGRPLPYYQSKLDKATAKFQSSIAPKDDRYNLA